MSEETANSPKPTIKLKSARKNARNKSVRDAAAKAPSVVEEKPEAPTPEPPPVQEIAIVGAELAAESPKKNKRRRRKGKGGRVETNEGAPAPKTDDTPQPPQQRPRLDPEQLAKFAWKIYLAEVSEEGVALIGDNDARELSRRCFRLAEIFLEEQSRRK
jgi:hypothetical protein